MLKIPEGASSIANIVGIDPGTEMLGMCVLSFDLDTFAIVGAHPRTYKGSNLPGSDWMSYIHGDRTKRIHSHRTNLLNVLNTHRPLYVGCESPFYNQKRPSAYGALTEIISAIRETVIFYDPWKPLYLIDPPTVKKAVGAPGNAAKEQVKASIEKIEKLRNVCPVPFTQLDEHSIDAMAVAYAIYVACRDSKLHPAG